MQNVQNKTKTHLLDIILSLGSEKNPSSDKILRKAVRRVFVSLTEHEGYAPVTIKIVIFTNEVQLPSKENI